MAGKYSQILVLCILASSTILASGFRVYDKPVFEDPNAKPGHGYSEDSCAPLDHWLTCTVFIEDSDLFKGPHKQWQPEADYHSLCCELVRGESTDCLCKAVSVDSAHMRIDLDRAMYLPKWCKKEVAAGTMCYGKQIHGYVDAEKDPFYGGHY